MNEPIHWNDTSLKTAMDRLAAGDLNESARESLLAFIDKHPEHWKQLAIKFLETQLWQEAYFHAAPKASALTPSCRMKSNSCNEVPHLGASLKSRFHQAQQIVTFAAAVLIAFGVGWVVSGQSRNSRFSKSIPSVVSPNDKGDRASTVEDEEWIWATVDTAAPNLPFLGVRVQVPLKIQNGNLMASTIDRAELSPYESQLYERRGLALSTERQIVNATLPDGTHVSLPVKHLIAKPIAFQVD